MSSESSAVSTLNGENPSPSALFLLPAEMLAAICAHLPAESVVAFQLTSRHLFQVVAPPRAGLDREQKLALLALLEKDNPQLYLCDQCDKLHPRRLTQPSTGIAHYDACCKGRPRSLPPHESYNLRFHVARLVMNRHFYGGEHGLPLDALHYQGTYHDPGTGVKVDQSWRARIIDDELYLETSVQLYHDKGSAAALRDFVDDPVGDARKLVCHHISLFRSKTTGTDGPQVPPWAMCNARVWELDRPPSSDDMFAPAKGELKSCRLCFTDFRINVQEQPLNDVGDGRDGYGWVIDVKRWVRLGECRSVSNCKWHNYVSHAENVFLPSRRFRVAGGVYKSWIKGDGETTRGRSDSLLARSSCPPFDSYSYY